MILFWKCLKFVSITALKFPENCRLGSTTSKPAILRKYTQGTFLFARKRIHIKLKNVCLYVFVGSQKRTKADETVHSVISAFTARKLITNTAHTFSFTVTLKFVTTTKYTYVKFTVYLL